MQEASAKALWEVMKVLFRPHPWHGISLGENAPDTVNCYIEIVPTDTIKYEIEKTTGYLKIDRPQRFSSAVPCLYGLLPQTYCGARVAELASLRDGGTTIRGDQDPLDVCVFSERPVSHGDVLLEAIPIGGLRMLDNNDADDKIIAVLKGDAVYGQLLDISEFPKPLLQRLTHYFMTYKQPPGDRSRHCEITDLYGRPQALDVILQSRADYDERFGHLAGLMNELISSAAR